MTRFQTKILSGVAIAALISGLAYTAAYCTLRSQLKTALHEAGYADIDIHGVGLYLDGLVVKRLDLANKQLSFYRVYFAGAPWKLLAGKPEYIYAENLHIDSENIFESPVHWPFHRNIPLTIRKADIQTMVLGRTIRLEGQMKRSPGTPLFFDFTSSSPEVIADGQTEIRTRKNVVRNIDIEFQDASLSFPLLKTKRSSGWLSFSWDNAWNVVGEVESGFANIPQNQFFDNSLKISGPVDNVDFTFSGATRNNKMQWVIDRHDGDLYLRYHNKAKQIPWGGLTNHMLEDISIEMLTVDLPAVAAKKDEPLEKKKNKPIQKLLDTAKADDADIVVAPKPVEQMRAPIPQESLQIESVKLPEMSLDKLLANSIFAGFFYGPHLVYLTHECPQDEDRNCWTARSQGGKLTYNPQAMPSYFTRLKDYEQSVQLRYILLSFDVQSMTISGKGDNVQQFSVKGKDADGRAAYIELSVNDLE